MTFLAISARGPGVTAAGSKTSSETAGMLLRLVVLPREIRVTAYVALSNGSSQQGNARRAAVGYDCNFKLEMEIEIREVRTYLELCQRIILGLSICFIGRTVVTHQTTSEVGFERNSNLHCGTFDQFRGQLECCTLRGLVESENTGRVNLRLIECRRSNSEGTKSEFRSVEGNTVRILLHVQTDKRDIYEHDRSTRRDGYLRDFNKTIKLGVLQVSANSEVIVSGLEVCWKTELGGIRGALGNRTSRHAH